RDHVDTCAPCRQEMERYRSIDRIVSGISRAPIAADRADVVRGHLEWRLAARRGRGVAARVLALPPRPLLVARSYDSRGGGEYLESARGTAASRLLRRHGIEIIEDGGETEAFYQQILEYLAGERTRLAWPLDFRLATSDFQREVLKATFALPYGAVVSYSHLAR